jgi:hypothetical protein
MPTERMRLDPRCPRPDNCPDDCSLTNFTLRHVPKRNKFSLSHIPKERYEEIFGCKEPKLDTE